VQFDIFRTHLFFNRNFEVRRLAKEITSSCRRYIKCAHKRETYYVNYDVVPGLSVPVNGECYVISVA
jgi:hypothetical protein